MRLLVTARFRSFQRRFSSRKGTSEHLPLCKSPGQFKAALFLAQPAGGEAKLLSTQVRDRVSELALA